MPLQACTRPPTPRSRAAPASASPAGPARTRSCRRCYLALAQKQRSCSLLGVAMLAWALSGIKGACWRTAAAPSMSHTYPIMDPLSSRPLPVPSLPCSTLLRPTWTPPPTSGTRCASHVLTLRQCTCPADPCLSLLGAGRTVARTGGQHFMATLRFSQDARPLSVPCPLGRCTTRARRRAPTPTSSW